jgi:hypothetical protein
MLGKVFLSFQKSKILNAKENPLSAFLNKGSDLVKQALSSVNEGVPQIQFNFA